MERLLAHLRQLVEVAGLQHAPGQLARSLRSLLDLPEVLDEFLRRDGAEVGATGLRCDADGIERRLELRLLEVALLHLLRHRQGEQAQHVEHDRALDLQRAPAQSQPAEAEDGIAQPAGLDQVRLGDAQPTEARLQAPVVEQCQFDRGVGRQGLPEDFRDAKAGVVGIALRALRSDRLPGAFLGQVGHLPHPAVGREGGAAGQDERRSGGSPQAHHGLPPCMG